MISILLIALFAFAAGVGTGAYGLYLFIQWGIRYELDKEAKEMGL